MAGTMALSAAEPLWKNGVPPPLAEDNPYLPGARNIVKLNYNKWKKGEDFSTLWLSWAVFDKRGPYRGNREIRDAVFRKFDAITLEREKKPLRILDHSRRYGDVQSLEPVRGTGQKTAGCLEGTSASKLPEKST